MKVAIFSAKKYDREFLSTANDSRHHLGFFEAHLNEETVSLATGFDAVCVFVNDHGPWSAYLNAAYGWARGTNVSSAQFLFDRDEFDYIRKNWVFLDHERGRVRVCDGIELQFASATGRSACSRR